MSEHDDIPDPAHIPDACEILGCEEGVDGYCMLCGNYAGVDAVLYDDDLNTEPTYMLDDYPRRWEDE